MARLFFLIFFLSGILAAQARADIFSVNNPDIDKFEFAYTYITALSYIKDIDDRWDQNAPKKLFANDEKKMVLATIDDLALDSSDLLVFKNYLKKYLVSPNRLARKVADTAVVASSQEIAINHDEKTLWEKWYDLLNAGQVTKQKQDDFVKTQYGLELQRKKIDTKIVQASILLTHVLLSQDNKGGKGHLLAVTAQERQRLLDKLDAYGANELDWGLKSGQTTLQASIAVIREVLEDSVWISIDEKQ